MRILAIAAMGFLAIIKSLLFLLSSTCAVVSNATIGLRILGAVFAVLFLWATVALVKQIAETNAKP
jgi:hypothetical protein